MNICHRNARAKSGCFRKQQHCSATLIGPAAAAAGAESSELSDETLVGSLKLDLQVT